MRRDRDSASRRYDVSVVVPIYRVERYLDDCVRSLLAQTLGDRLQIVLVDDGSPDRCGEIADGYAERYGNIICVHRENGGLGPARNSGIDAACGEYVGFVDSDDWVDSDMYKGLLGRARETGADAVFSGMKTICGGERVADFPVPYGNAVFDGIDAVMDFRKTFYGAAPSREAMEPMQVSVCPAIYKRELLNRSYIRFENTRSEDIVFNLDALGAMRIVATMPQLYYSYRKEQQESITSTFKRSTLMEYFLLFDLVEQRLVKERGKLGEQCRLRFHRRVIDCSRGMLQGIFSGAFDSAEKDELVRIVLEASMLKDAMAGYPWWKLSLKQALFFVAMRSGWKGTLQLMSSLNRR